MKHLLTGVAVVAALAFAAPSWAQPASPSGGNAMGVPGPNPGGPGLTPYSGGAPPRATAAPPPSAPPAAMAPAAAETSSAMPPGHRHARHVSHEKMAAHHRGGVPQLTGGSAEQLNQEELARLQAGNLSNPPVVPSNPLPGAPAGRGVGPKTSGSSYIPPASGAGMSPMAPESASMSQGGAKPSGSGYIAPTPGAGMSPPPSSPPLVGTTPGGAP